jgi:autotransporter-associated beta strand protein
MKRALAPFVFLTAGCLAIAALPTAPVPEGVVNETLLYINGYYYQPFSSTLPAGTKVYMDADSSLLRATQRSLGFREVDYKKFFFGSLSFSAVSPDTDALGNTVYNYGSLSTSSTLAGYWTKKNLPIILGVDGNGYITDGHHTTAGYLATDGVPLIAGKNHIVLGTTVANPSSQSSVGDQMWSDFLQVNNAYLYGTSGNQLAQPSDSGYGGLQPIMPSTAVMPSTPGKASMTNDLYRSLAWGAVDGIVNAATSLSGSKITGFSKVDSTSSLSSKPDVNFVEFFWADFLRNRVVWNDNAAVTSANLINAPVSFFAATANAIALAKSELYTDQFGRGLVDYTGSLYSQNTRTWANASLLNGLAVSGDTYNMFLTDDTTIQGDLIPSGMDGVVNNLSINTSSGTMITGALQNFSSIAVNTGGTMTINWKDSAVNAVAQNTLLTIPAGTGDVTFGGNNDFTKLASLVVGAGTLTIDTTNSVVEQTVWGVVSGPGMLRKTGREALTLSGANTISGGVYLEEGVLVLASSSVLNGTTLISSPIGTGSLWMKDGTTLAFDESVRLENGINVTPAADSAGVSIHVGEGSVEFGGRLSSGGSLSISGQQSSVLTLSGTSAVSGQITVNAVTLRLANSFQAPPDRFNLIAGATIQAASDVSISSEIVVLDDAKLDGGESLLEVGGNISGDGRLTIGGLPYGTVRLSGLNTYTGGTVVDQARVEIAQGGADDSSGGVGSGRVFGTGSVTLNSAVLGFVDSANVSNELVLNGSSNVDVGSYSAQLSGVISGSGSLLITGTREGSLLLSQAENSFAGSTAVEGTTLRILSSADRTVFGNSDSDLYLNDAALVILPDLLVPGTLGSFGSRSLQLGLLGGVLDAGDNDVVWSGTISGPGKLSVGSSLGNSVQLSGTNSYKGGTEIFGGGSVVFSRDSNLGDPSGFVTIIQGGVVYQGTQDLSWERHLKVDGIGMFDMGGRTITVSGTVYGAGQLEVGRSGSRGTLVLGASSASFSGGLVLSGGSVSVSHADALKGANVEIPAAGGSLNFTTSDADIGGLSGDGILALPANFKLTIGALGKSSAYLGAVSGAGATITKSGTGKFTLAGTVDVASAVVSSGELALGTTGSLSTAVKLSIANGAALSVYGTHNLVGNFGAAISESISPGATIVFDGPAGSELRLPRAVAERISLVNSGSGTILAVNASGEISSAQSRSGWYLNDATLLVKPEWVASGALVSLASRSLDLGPLGGTLDANNSGVVWSGTITGLGKLSAGVSKGTSAQLSGMNSYKGGTEITGGGNVVFSADANLGDSAGSVTFNQGGLVYAGSQDLTWGRPLKADGVGMLDMGARTITVSGTVSGAGRLEVGRFGSRGTLSLGQSSASLSGTLVLSGGTISVSHAEALKGATAELSASGGALKFTTPEASLGGLSGDGSLALPANFKLTIGSTGKTSSYSGAVSGVGATITKSGSGKFTLAGTVDVASAVVSSGELVLGTSGALSAAVKLSIANGAGLSVYGTHNLVGNFGIADLDSISAGATIRFDGPLGSELRLPKAVADLVSLVNSGSGTILAVSASGEVSSVQNKFGAGSEATVSKLQVATRLDNGAKVNIDSSAGPVSIADFSGLKGGGVDTYVTLPPTGVLNYSTSLSGFVGTLLTDGTVIVTSAAGNGQTALLPIKGSASINVVAGGSVKFATSPEYTGTTSLGTGAVAELSGSLNKESTINLSASSLVNVNPSGMTSLVMPSLAGAGGLVSLNSGSVHLAGNSANFGGTLVVERGVSVTVSGDLPKGTVQLKDPTMPVRVDTSAGSIHLPGTVKGEGVLALSGTGKLTMGAGAAIQTAELRIGTSATDRPVLDVSQVTSGLVLTSSQTLAGGGTVVGSVRTSGAFKPGNSPGLFTVAKSTATPSGGNLYLDSSSVTQIEYGMRADNSLYEWDKVVLAGTLTVANGARIVAVPYTGTDSRGVTFINGILPSSLRLRGAFTAGSLSLGSAVPELQDPSYLFSSRWERTGSTLDIVIERANYGQKVGSERLQNLGSYLSAASEAPLSGTFSSLINGLDQVTSQDQLRAALQSISSSVYAEAQRLSVRRTSAIAETIQKRLNPAGVEETEGWSAWSEAYAWSLHRNAAALAGSWNGNTSGGVAGVQRTIKGLTIGIVGATGRSSATLSNPGSSLSVDSFHGGSYANVDLGRAFINAGFIAGSADQTVRRDVSLGGLGGAARSKFQTSEYSAHLGGGFQFENLVRGISVIPSVSIVSSGVVQDGSRESGAGPLSVSTSRRKLSAWQSRTGTEVSRRFTVAGGGLNLSSSVHWVHDFDSKPMSTPTRFNEASGRVGAYQSLGSRVGADAFEFGVGAALEVSERTTIRLNGNCQIREGSNQPGASLGINVRF